jgi:hypothetical protein
MKNIVPDLLAPLCFHHVPSDLADLLCLLFLLHHQKLCFEKFQRPRLHSNASQWNFVLQIICAGGGAKGLPARKHAIGAAA